MVSATADHRLLASASRLFALTGVGATSIRAIIRDAGVNLNAIHYHFGSRRGLLAAVWDREMEPIRAERDLAMKHLRETPEARDVLDAMYRPVLRRGLSPPQSAEARGLLVIQQIRNDPSLDARAVLAAHEDEIAPAFERVLSRALRCPPRRLAPLLVFINGAAWDAAAQAVLAALAGARLKLSVNRFFDFATAGMLSALREGRSDRVPDA